MNDETCGKCGEVMSCDCGKSNQQVIENYLEDGYDVEFLDDEVDEAIIFGKFEGRFYGANCVNNAFYWECDGDAVKKFTKIKIYKEETNEEKIKRLLEDGKVKCKNKSGNDVVIHEFFEEDYYGRVFLEGKWVGTRNFDEFKGIEKLTNITPYTNE